MQISNDGSVLPAESAARPASLTRRFNAPSAARLCAAAFIGMTLLLASALGAPAGDFDTDISIDELMEAVVMPQADAIWSAVQFASTADGEEMIGPATDDEWLELRHSAITLAEVANSLMVPGRPAAAPGTAANPGELAPEAIESLIDNQRAAWNGFAHALHGIAMQVVFWYPEQN